MFAKAAVALTAVVLAVPPRAQAQGMIPPEPAAPPEYPVPMAEYPALGAQPDWMANRGLQLGARVGYSFGAGDIYSGLGVSDTSNGSVPVMIDLGFRALPELYVGAFGQYAPVFLKTNPASCPDGFTCSAADLRFGLEADLHVAPRTRLDPYIGIGVGYEVLRTTFEGTSPVPLPTGATAKGRVDTSITDRGWEYAALTLGFDYRLSSGVGVGPFATATLGAFDAHTGTTAVTVNGRSASNAVSDMPHATHETFIVGLRGTFNP